MFQTDILINISVLPSNIMSLRDNNFSDFVQEEASHAAAALFELQGINSVKSLLMIDDVFSIMTVKSKSLDEFKNKYGYIQDDGTCVIQPGVKGNTEYLIIEGKDYFISLQNDSSGTLKCYIKCCCEKLITLVFRHEKFQLSNFYRHLQGLTNECPALKNNFYNSSISSPLSTNNQQPLITSDNVLQQIVSPNSISIISSSDTIQSNSTSVTASSMSKSTVDDETCDENIIEQPSSSKTKRQVKRKV
ncbi:unnamed protein product [Adineta steineri]|uniref:Uncharacterized protein n=1 Tax=Adineta steineri TaxID=433720 RepID=A0A815NXB7_9BILA|nr:unnamed protein product [Adineta steineri]CAF1627447.1 unnamed protein product [Adineta steineri]